MYAYINRMYFLKEENSKIQEFKNSRVNIFTALGCKYLNFLYFYYLVCKIVEYEY